MIQCIKCNIEKDESDFYPCHIRASIYICKKCKNKENAEYYKNNKEKIKVRTHKYYLRNKFICNNKKLIRDMIEKQHKEMLTDKELNKLNLYYRISEYLGPEWEVDHIVPISKGGLHHPDNVQIISRDDNRSKTNKLDYKPKHSIRIENLKKELGL